MGLQKNGGDADGDGSPGKDRSKFALPSCGHSLTAWLLHRMGGVKDNGIAALGKDGQGPEVGNKSVVAETAAAFANEDIVIAGSGDFLDHMDHVPGCQKLTFLDIDGAPGGTGR